MKTTLISLSLFAALAIGGCGSNDASTDASAPAPSASSDKGGSAVVVAYDLGSKKKGDKGICVICNKNEGTTAEEDVVETLDYQGKTYVFCNEKEKADFISDPKKYAKP
jgi:YHS domain-containing protein